MTSLAGPLPGREPGIVDGLRALPLTVVCLLTFDAVASLVSQAYGDPGAGTGVLPVLQLLVEPLAAAAVVWRRPRIAVVLLAVVVTLAFVVGPSGGEALLLIITAVTAGARASGRQLALVGLAQLAYVVAFGVNAESANPGWGWPTGLSLLGVTAVSFGVALVARRQLRLRDERRRQVAEVGRVNAQIRAVERIRLADDLQLTLTEGLAAIDAETDDLLRRTDADGLRDGLDRVDARCRSLLGQLRTLLEVLRRDPVDPAPVGVAAEGAGPVPTGPRRWLDLLTARHVRIAGSALFGLLALRALFTLLVVRPGGTLDPAGPSGAQWVQVLGLTACAVAVWRPRVGAAIAAVGLAVAVLLSTDGSWDVLPVGLLVLLVTVGRGPRALVWLVAAIGAYAGLLALVGAPELLGRVLVAGYATVLTAAMGLTAHHLLAARRDADRALVALGAERERMGADERNAVARELHDVVAHQLSRTAMAVLATSLSEDPVVLAETVGQVRGCTEAAHEELATLLSTMRRPESDQLRTTPLVTPRASADVLAQRLTDHGYQPVLDLDPATDGLDPTAQRTLSRIMQEAATNILRYTPAGSSCRYFVAVADSAVTLRISSPLAADPRPHALSSGWGLLGVRERVDLSRGTFRAGPEHGDWVVAVTLPTDRAALGLAV